RRRRVQRSLRGRCRGTHSFEAGGSAGKSARTAAADQRREYHGRASQEHRGCWRRRAGAEKERRQAARGGQRPETEGGLEGKKRNRAGPSSAEGALRFDPNEGKKDQVTSEEQGDKIDVRSSAQRIRLPSVFHRTVSAVRRHRRQPLGAPLNPSVPCFVTDSGLSASDRKHGSRPSGSLHAPPPGGSPMAAGQTA